MLSKPNRCNKLDPSFVKRYSQTPVPWGPIGYIVYKRTYARKIDESRTEEWWQTVERCVNAVLKLGVFTDDEAKTLYHYVFNLKCCFSGRSLWQLGTSTVDRFGGDSLQSCWCVPVNEPILPFCFTFDELMLGGGVGFNVQQSQVYSLPSVRHSPVIQRVESNDCDFIVPDNREGWVKLLAKTLKRFFISGEPLRYSTSCIRARGKAIASFGGTASGSEELVKGIESIANILRGRVGQKITPVDGLDIMNIIGSIVVSGNVRRSAELALGDARDSDYINAKNWNLNTVPNWRAMSNNSVVIDSMNDFPPELWASYLGDGEPLGLVNLSACRKLGRLLDGEGYIDDSGVIGVNPCAEITLEPYEACNLSDIFLPNIHTLEEFKTAASLMYKVCKSISTLPFIHKETNEVVTRNRRLGISITGFMQSQWRGDTNAFDTVYNHLRWLDVEYSTLLGVKTSKKITTVKPSGTLSLLAGVTAGAHPAFSEYYIRRVTMASDDKLLDVCQENGYKISPRINFDGTLDLKAMIVEFPVKTPSNTVFAKDMSAVQQLESQKWLQEYWSDNSVSLTVYYHKDELSDIRGWLTSNIDSVKSTSFLLHSEHGFLQAPLEEISESTYRELSSKVTPVTSVEGMTDLVDSFECGKGGCPIK